MGRLPAGEPTPTVDLIHPKESSVPYRQGKPIRVESVPMGRLPAGERTSMVDSRLRKDSSARFRQGKPIRVESVPMGRLPAGVIEERGVSTHQTERF